MVYKMCDKCKRFFGWTPEDPEWSTLVMRERDRVKRIYLCPDCTEKLLKLIESEDEWRWIHG